MWLLLSSQQDIDFCLSVSKAGGRIFCEPTSVVTHVSEMSYHWSDLAYFMLRWSDAWEIESLMHFQQKWSLEMTQYLIERYKQIGHRRHQLLRFLLQQITGGRQVSWLEKWAFDIEQWLNQAIIDGNVQHSNNMSIQLPSVTVSSRKNTPTKE